MSTIPTSSIGISHPLQLPNWHGVRPVISPRLRCDSPTCNCAPSMHRAGSFQALIIRCGDLLIKFALLLLYAQDQILSKSCASPLEVVDATKSFAPCAHSSPHNILRATLITEKFGPRLGSMRPTDATIDTVFGTTLVAA